MIASIGSSFWGKKTSPSPTFIQFKVMVSQNAIGHIYQLSPKKEAIDLNVVHLLMTDEATYG